MELINPLTKELREKADQLGDYLLSGRVKTFDEYKGVCGEIRGLLTAIEFAKDLKTRMEHDDDT